MSPFEVAGTLLACLESAYTTAADTGPPAQFCHRPGAEALLDFGNGVDDCCAGLGWVRVVSIDPVIDPAQSEEANFSPCDNVRSAITLELGVARCNPATSDCEALTALAARMDLDATRMRQAVCCASTALVTDASFVYRVLRGAWEPIESLGSCAGGTMRVTVWTDCTDC